MEGCFTYQDLKGLQDLLAPPKQDSDSEDDLPQSGTKSLAVEKHVGPHATLKEDVEIWHPSEAKNIELSEDHDPRETPEYEMKFKQSVGTEDVFFGMGFKNPSTASCEWLSIFIKLPFETREKVELSVKSDAIDLHSPKYRLHLPTPHSVDPNASSAKWHTDNSTLEISLRLVRELDDVNF